MSEYYAVQRSSEYLAHYGVKGMKWGVKKAIERGNSASLNRHYNKAQRKLSTLNARANKNLVNRARGELKKKMAGDVAKSIGASALGTMAINGFQSNALPYAAGAAALGGIASLASHGIAQARLRRMASKKGHAKAVAKRNEFQREMKNSFRGAKGLNKKPNIINRPNTSGLNRNQRKQVNSAMEQWAKSFEKHYQTGLSKGMSHEQAERYSNNYIARHGFGKPQSRNRRKSK